MQFLLFGPSCTAKQIEALEPHRPTGAILGWKWVRLLTPFINLYAFVFLVGGAVMSAISYKKSGGSSQQVWGNVSIALGGLLPGIGGSMAKAGHVEVLYVLELVGLIFIWIGYGVIARTAHKPAVQETVSQPT